MLLLAIHRKACGIAALVFLALASQSPAMPVEASDPVAGFLRRLEEKGVIAPGLWSTLPRDSREIAAALAEAASQPGSLSEWDRRRVEYYLDLFDPERRRAQSKFHREDGSFTLLGTVQFYAGLAFRDSLPHPDAHSFGSLTPGLEATYRDWAYLTSSGTVGMERSRYPRFQPNADPARGLPYNVNREGLNDFSTQVSTFDGLRLMAGVGTDEIRLEAGQDWNQWGPGHWQHATLGTRPYFWVADSLAESPQTGYPGTEFPGSHRRGYRYPGEGPPLPQLRLRFGTRQWEYTKVVAQRTGLWKDSAAALVAHRVQFRAGNWRMGATEMLAVGSRDMGWLILVPGLPLRIAEHLAGDRDNAAMSADVEWIWKGRGRFYGEFFLDDFSGLPLDFWGNKFAWTLGVALQDAFGLQNEVHLEYARVDPWVYGHDGRGTQMQSFGALLGSSLPPNSHSVWGSWALPLHRNIEGGVEFRFFQRDYQSGGSSIFHVENGPLYGYHKDFLARNVETHQEAALQLKWTWSHYVELRGQAGWLHVEGWKGEPGRSVSSPAVSSDIFLRY